MPQLATTRTLDQLVATAAARRQARRGWQAPVAAGVAALLVVLGIAAVGLLGHDRGSPPMDPAGSSPGGSGTAAETLLALAGAARRVAPPDDLASPFWYRQRLDVVVAAGKPCRVLTARIETWEPAIDPDQPTGRIVAELAEPPAAAMSLAGCTAWAAVRIEPFEDAGDVVGAWEELASQLGDLTPRYLPSRLVTLEQPPADYPQPAQLADVLEAGAQETDAPGGWWAALVRLLASPQPDPQLRAAALAAAALQPEATTMPDRTADVTGRPGVTVRVPYYRDGETVSADLTFDTATGGLLQSVVHSPTGTAITVHLTIGQ